MIRTDAGDARRGGGQCRWLIRLVGLITVATGAANPGTARAEGPKDESGRLKLLPAGFDERYISPDAVGAIGVRPAALWEHVKKAHVAGAGPREFQGMDAERWLMMLLCESLGDAVTIVVGGVTPELPHIKFNLLPRQIDQMVIEGTARFCRNGESDSDFESLVPTRVMIRMVEPFDWVQRLREWGFELTERREAAGLSYAAKKDDPDDRPRFFNAFTTDDRTIVVKFDDVPRSEVEKARAVVDPFPEPREDALLSLGMRNDNGYWPRAAVGSNREGNVRTFFQDVDLLRLSISESPDPKVRAWIMGGAQADLAARVERYFRSSLRKVPDGDKVRLTVAPARPAAGGFSGSISMIEVAEIQDLDAQFETIVNTGFRFREVEP